jgi:hypothetical protein
MIINPPGNLTDAQYARFQDADEDILRPLDSAYNDVENAFADVEAHGIDNDKQREYARTLVDAIRYRLGLIADILEAK